MKEEKKEDNENRDNVKEKKIKTSFQSKAKILKENSISNSSVSSDLKKNQSVNNEKKPKKTEIFWIDGSNEKHNKKYEELFKKFKSNQIFSKNLTLNFFKVFLNQFRI